MKKKRRETEGSAFDGANGKSWCKLKHLVDSSDFELMLHFTSRAGMADNVAKVFHLSVIVKCAGIQAYSEFGMLRW